MSNRLAGLILVTLICTTGFLSDEEALDKLLRIAVILFALGVALLGRTAQYHWKD